MQLRCYCCGEPLGVTFVLVTMRTGAVDRAFVAKPDHVERMDDVQSVLVSRADPAAESLRASA